MEAVAVAPLLRKSDCNKKVLAVASDSLDYREWIVGK
jgi:hypothetical protein